MQNREVKASDRKPSDRKKFTKPAVDDSIQSKLVDVNRVTKVVKGGRTMRFAALVVVGDKKGKVGVGTGKAAEVPTAIEKATQIGKKGMFKVTIVGTTIPHEVTGVFGKSMVKLIPSAEGTGVIAGGAVRPVVELAGIKDITAKIYGSRNKANCVKATLNALKQLRTVEEIAALRGLTVEEILGKAE